MVEGAAGEGDVERADAAIADLHGAFEQAVLEYGAIALYLYSACEQAIAEGGWIVDIHITISYVQPDEHAAAGTLVIADVGGEFGGHHVRIGRIRARTHHGQLF